MQNTATRTRAARVTFTMFLRRRIDSSLVVFAKLAGSREQARVAFTLYGRQYWCCTGYRAIGGDSNIA